MQPAILLQSIKYCFKPQSWINVFSPFVMRTIIPHTWRWDHFTLLFLLCTSHSWHIFNSSGVRFFLNDWTLVEFTCSQLVIFCTWFSMSHCRGGLVSLSRFFSASVSLNLPASLPLTLSGYLPFHGGPFVTLFIVLFGWLWRTMAVWSLGRHSACVNLRLSIGSAVLRCQERLCDLCATEGGFHRWESEPQREGFILCQRVCWWVCVCACVHTACGILYNQVS